MKTRLYLYAAIGALAFGPACANGPAAQDAAEIEVIVVKAKRLAAPAETDSTAAARALTEQKPEIALPEVEIRIASAPEDRG